MDRMSRFEVEAVNWYWENASGWAAKMGITAREFERLRLKGLRRKLFLEAMEMIEGAVNEIRSKQARG
jgi:hypothetical protein